MSTAYHTKYGQAAKTPINDEEKLWTNFIRIVDLRKKFSQKRSFFNKTDGLKSNIEKKNCVIIILC